MHGFLQERSNAYTSIIFTEESVSNKVSSVTLFSPILTYSSEVWGIYDKCDFSSWENDPIEKRHIHFCKMCLGLNKRSPNVASRNELRRLSLKLQITMNTLKFWIHLKNQPPDSIAKLCLNISV